MPEPPPQAVGEHMEEVRVAPVSIARLQEVLAPDVWEAFSNNLDLAREVFGERVFWNVNSTAMGGGVAEMLRSFVSYSRGVGLNMRWMVISGTPEFFQITKRIHNFLHGAPGDGGELGPAEARIYEDVARANAEDLIATVRPEDIVLLHDPQTAGMIERVRQVGAKVVWRSHIGVETPNDYVHRAWDFLGPYVEHADACVFTRRPYIPDRDGFPPTVIIPPSIDVLSAKNQPMSDEAVRAVLSHVGLVSDGVPADIMPTYTRQDETPGRVDHMCEVLSTGPPPSFDTPLVTQVSRWDRLKDHLGVMHAFARHVTDGTAAHLILAGPNVRAVADDPEGAEVLNEVETAWRELSHVQRSRIHLACLPMHDVEENAAIVNALQRHATVVVQKSIEEGFGLTVAEAMWKERPVVASAVGGIKDQIEDGVSGLLLEDPHDLEHFGRLVASLLEDPERAREMGERARKRVLDEYIETRHSAQYVELFGGLLAEGVVAQRATGPQSL